MQDNAVVKHLRVKFEFLRCFLASISCRYASTRSLVTLGSYLLKCSLIVPCWRIQAAKS